MVFCKGGGASQESKNGGAPKNAIKVNNSVISVKPVVFVGVRKCSKKKCWFFEEMKQMFLEKY